MFLCILLITEEWIRPVLKRDRSILVHSYYQPDSHDSWISNVEIDWEPESSQTRSSPLEVSLKKQLKTSLKQKPLT